MVLFEANFIGLGSYGSVSKGGPKQILGFPKGELHLFFNNTCYSLDRTLERVVFLSE